MATKSSVRPLMLVVLDGFGIGDGGSADATALAHGPFFDEISERYPSARVETSGEAVGLPAGQMGNSEVGHMTMGAGRIIDQDLTRISKALAGGAMQSNPQITALLDATKASGGTLHLIGLVSDGGVHSHQEHLYAILKACGARGIPCAVHALLDGRDTPPSSGIDFVRALVPHVERAGAHFATVIGRYFAMDRDNRWERVGKAYDAMLLREGAEASDAIAAVEAGYARGETDEFLEPTCIAGGKAIDDGDTVFFFNFRSDRARQITNALSGAAPQKFAGQFERKRIAKLASYLCMTEYDADFGLPVAFSADRPAKILGEVIAEADLAQLRTAETEKYAHVTFFFNGGLEEPFPGEDRVLVASPRDVATYDHKPEMSALQVTEGLLGKIQGGEYDFILVNYANPDMIGHTGVLDAAVKAIETIDSCLRNVCEAVLAKGGEVLITADHGNCEQMVDPETGGPHTAHTTNPVPLYWLTANPQGRVLKDGGLADIAPTVLSLMGLEIPSEMTGVPLVVART